jgi:hypothetical protein
VGYGVERGGGERGHAGGRIVDAAATFGAGRVVAASVAMGGWWLVVPWVTRRRDLVGSLNYYYYSRYHR